MQAVQQLRDQVLDPHWAAFNYDRLPPAFLFEIIC
jgi:DNA polymerase-3 subunit delta